MQVFFLPFNMAFANGMVTLFVFDSAEFVRERLFDAVRIRFEFRHGGTVLNLIFMSTLDGRAIIILRSREST